MKKIIVLVALAATTFAFAGLSTTTITTTPDGSTIIVDPYAD